MNEGSSGACEAEGVGHVLLLPGRKRESCRERAPLADAAAEVVDDLVGILQARPEIFTYLAGEFEVQRVVGFRDIELEAIGYSDGFMSQAAESRQPAAGSRMNP
ncbi:hypothetical protein LGM65_00660 [Burkholderia anthina]|uniref:hypothetical protein n=1 Tax=Burkholderia anthina TaxID=179879 RepID=UPI001CF599F6|nr:hypothetical protein [Burkholderia anthina]MCA8089406.1 hypothetical protein [Burkholderia anthina]